MIDYPDTLRQLREGLVGNDGEPLPVPYEPVFCFDQAEMVLTAAKEQLKELLGAELEQLGRSLEKPARIAQSLSQAIRKLEDEQTEVTGLMQLLGRIERLEVLLDKIETHRKLVKEGRGSDGFENLCNLFHELAQYPKSVFAAATCRRITGKQSAEDEFAEKKAWIVGLLLEEYQKGKNSAAKILSLLLGSVGIDEDSPEEDQISKALCAQFQADLAKSVQNSGGQLSFAIRIARIIDHTSQFINSLGEVPVRLLKGILEEADLAIGGLICEYRNLILGLSVVDLTSQVIPKQDQTSATLRKLDIDLTEMALICRHGLHFLGYVASLYNGHNPMKNPLLLPSIHLQRGSLLKEYPDMELRYLTLGIGKAREIDTQLADSGYAQSSSVDDTFFLVKKIIYRAISMLDSSYERAIIQGLLGSLSRILEDSFLAPILQRKQSISASLDKPENRKAYVRYANDLAASLVFLGKLLAHLTTIFPEDTQIVSNIFRFYQTVLAQMHTSVECLYGQFVKTRVGLLLQTVLIPSLTYDQDEISEAINQIYDRLMQDFPFLQASLGGATVCPAICRQLDLLAAQEIAATWEEQLLHKIPRLSEMAALQLDRSIRQIQGFLVDRHKDNTAIPQNEAQIDQVIMDFSDDGHQFKAVFGRLLEICKVFLTDTFHPDKLTDQEIEFLKRKRIK